MFRPTHVGKCARGIGRERQGRRESREDAMRDVSATPPELLDAELTPAPRRRRFAPEPGEVRCECLVCSAHAFAQPGAEGSGHCGNCGSHDLRPLTRVA